MNTKTALIIEDNAALREMIRRRLIRRGLAIICAVDGESGIEIARKEGVDIILLDMNLPGKNGWDVAQKLKSMENTAIIPIIAITAHAMRGDRERTLQAGCDEYVSKPIDFDMLLEKIAELMAL